MKYIIIVIFLLLFTSCKIDNNKISFINDISITDTLKAKVHKINKDLFMPSKVFSIKDKLVVFDNTKDSIFKVFKEPEIDYLYSFGDIGRGPEEFTFIDANSMKIFENKLMFLDHKELKFFKINDTDMNISHSKPIKAEAKPVNRLRMLNDSIYISDVFPEKKGNYEYQMINANSRKLIKEFGDYPQLNVDFKNENQRYNAFLKSTVIHPINNKIASFYIYFNKIKIYNNDGSLLKNVNVNNNFPKFEIKNRRKNLLYRSEPIAFRDFIYVLSFNKSKLEIESSISSLKPKLEIWNWQGE
jgi:hypothetical protein